MFAMCGAHGFARELEVASFPFRGWLQLPHALLAPADASPSPKPALTLSVSVGPCTSVSLSRVDDAPQGVVGAAPSTSAVAIVDWYHNLQAFM